MLPDVKLTRVIDDALDTYRFLIEEKKIPPQNIVIHGCSGGGMLVFLMLLKAKQLGVPLPAGSIISSPGFVYFGEIDSARSWTRTHSE
jgi:monoterpene epsilon-lactone hydrolase